MARAALRAFSGSIRFILVAMAAAVVGQASGCGGQVLDGEGDTSALGGGSNGSGDTPGAAGVGSTNGGVGGSGTAGTRNSGGRSSTGGFTSTGGRIAPGGFTGVGGWPATGGLPATGAVTGAGGGPTMDAPTLCYAQGGVYFPGGGGCFLGGETHAACVRQAAPLTRSCDTRCACLACPSFYSRCLNDGGCQFILACAQLELCRGVESCMKKPTCEFLINRAGGRSSAGAFYFDQYSKCMDDSRCSCDNL